MNLVKKTLTALFLTTFVGGQMPAYADGTSPQRVMTGEGTSMDVAGAASGGETGSEVPWREIGFGALALAVVVVGVADDGKKVADEDPDDEYPVPVPTWGTGTSTSTGTN